MQILLILSSGVSLSSYKNSKFDSSASTKSRSEISCTGAKAYKQKGTGNARRGRNSSNLRRGGYRAFGPSPRYFNFSLNKKLIKKIPCYFFKQTALSLTLNTINQINIFRDHNGVK